MSGTSYPEALGQGHPEHGAEDRDDFGARLGMWLFLVTEIVLFGGLFIGYSYMRAKYPAEFHHAGSDLNATIGVINTLILLTSSLTMVLSLVAIQRGERSKTRLFLGATILLGAAFLVNKSFEWAAKFHHGLYPNAPHLATLPPGEQVFFGLYFTMTGLHGLHVLAGISVLAWLYLLVSKGRITQDRHAALENGGLYWHLVDVIWIFLLPLFYLAA
jgi:cytochrome c oxidase subunit III